MGPVDHRKAALIITAQLAVFEGSQLRISVLNYPHDAPELWRQLYWFTRFYRAWQRIQIGLSPAQFVALEKKAKKARAWKRAAWAYYLAKIANSSTQSVRTIATNFVKQRPDDVSAHEVQIYLGRRVSLAPDRKAGLKETVGRPSPNTRR